MRPQPKVLAITEIADGFELSGESVGVLVSGITHNSREVLPGDIYVALQGANHHGIEFAPQAIANGAVAIATDQTGINELVDVKLPLIKLIEPRIEMARLAARVYQNPEQKLKLIGVTGTNGKTSVTHILKSLFENFGYQVGVIGTIGTYIGGNFLPGTRTTPESTDLYAVLAKMVEAKVTHVFMEVSSHALELHRVAGLQFDEAVFTNLSQDHLDFHGSMENYFGAKAKLFTKEFTKHCVICVDDIWGQKLADQTLLPKSTVNSTANVTADWNVKDLHLAVTNTDFLLGFGLQDLPCSIPMIGQFNATNAAIAIATAVSLGLDFELATHELAKVLPVPGRSQIVTHNSLGTAIVDYAHTPEAVEKVLSTLREVCAGQLITVIGCGGDRDATKRPLMGAIAAEISDVVVVSDDNPRSENPATIRQAIITGIPDFTNALEQQTLLEIGDRRAAIKYALTRAGHNDVIAVLGKGHEQGQEIAGTIYPFDDVTVIAEEAANV